MHRFRFVLASLFIGLTMASVLVAQDYYRRVDIFQLVNGLVLGEAKLSGMSTPSAGVVQLGGTDVTTLTSLAGASTRTPAPNSGSCISRRRRRSSRRSAIATTTASSSSIRRTASATFTPPTCRRRRTSSTNGTAASTCPSVSAFPASGADAAISR